MVKSSDQANKAMIEWLENLRQDTGYYDERLDDTRAVQKLKRLLNIDMSINQDLKVTKTRHDYDVSLVQAISSALFLEPTIKERLKGVYLAICPTEKVKNALIDGLRAYVKWWEDGSISIILNTGLINCLSIMGFYIPVQFADNLEYYNLADNDPMVLTYTCAVSACWDKRFSGIHSDQHLMSFLPESSAHRVDALYITALIFVVGHEISHVLQEQDEETIPKDSYTQELEADSFGLQRAMKTFWEVVPSIEDKKNAIYLLLGPYMALSMIGLVTGGGKSLRHPSLETRLSNINRRFKDVMKWAVPEISVIEEDQQHYLALADRIIIAGSEMVRKHIRYHLVSNKILDDYFRCETWPKASLSRMYNFPCDFIVQRVARYHKDDLHKHSVQVAFSRVVLRKATERFEKKYFEESNDN